MNKTRIEIFSPVIYQIGVFKRMIVVIRLGNSIVRQIGQARRITFAPSGTTPICQPRDRARRKHRPGTASLMEAASSRHCMPPGEHANTFQASTAVAMNSR